MARITSLLSTLLIVFSSSVVCSPISSGSLYSNFGSRIPPQYLYEEIAYEKGCDSHRNFKMSCMGKEVLDDYRCRYGSYSCYCCGKIYNYIEHGDICTKFCPIPSAFQSRSYGQSRLISLPNAFGTGPESIRLEVGDVEESEGEFVGSGEQQQDSMAVEGGKAVKDKKVVADNKAAGKAKVTEETKLDEETRVDDDNQQVVTSSVEDTTFRLPKELEPLFQEDSLADNPVERVPKEARDLALETRGSAVPVFSPTMQLSASSQLYFPAD